MTLVGGAVFASLAAGSYVDGVAARWRPIALTAAALAFLSGLYTLLNKAYAPPGYHLWFGIKFLLALHIFAVSVISTKPDVPPAKRQRMATGMMLSGMTIVAISAYLRWMR
jgi:hypothetical protein